MPIGQCDAYIETDRYNPDPAEARVVRYGVSVWAIIGYLRAVSQDVECLARDYDLPLDVVNAAIEYYKDHSAAIDARIDANESEKRDG